VTRVDIRKFRCTLLPQAPAAAAAAAAASADDTAPLASAAAAAGLTGVAATRVRRESATRRKVKEEEVEKRRESMLNDVIWICEGKMGNLYFVRANCVMKRYSGLLTMVMVII
jgi:hypothetical protein